MFNFSLFSFLEGFRRSKKKEEKKRVKNKTNYKKLQYLKNAKLKNEFRNFEVTIYLTKKRKVRKEKGNKIIMKPLIISIVNSKLPS